MYIISSENRGLVGEWFSFINLSSQYNNNYKLPLQSLVQFYFSFIQNKYVLAKVSSILPFLNIKLASHLAKNLSVF